MNELSDTQLLRDYAERRSEAAFAELVSRHIDLVHSTAVRLVNDAHLAKDLSQAVFVALAKDAGKLSKHPVLAGWLHRTTRNIASQTVRTDVRRRNREHASALNEAPESNVVWKEIAPHLDVALGELSTSDRDAVLLRYFENKPANEMSEILGVSAEGAQKRVSRAVEKLRKNLAKRGITAGAAGLIGTISANAVQVAPVGLAGAIAGSAVATTASLAITKTLIMTTIQKTWIAVTIGSLGIATFQARKSTRLEAEVNQLRQTSDQLAANKINLRGDPKENIKILSDVDLARNKKIKRMERMAREKTEEMREAGMLAKKNAPNYVLIGEDGRITQQAIRQAGINHSEAQAIQKLLDGYWDEVSVRLAATTRLDENSSRPDEGVFAYDIPALPDGGAEYVSKIEQGIRKIAGISAGNILLDAFQPNTVLCGFGKYDVHVEVTKGSEGEGSKPISAKFSFVYPPTSQVVSRGQVAREYFYEKFGSIFDELEKTELVPGSAKR